MTREQLNYTENLKCCNYCRHLRCNHVGTLFCSLMDYPDNLVQSVDVCDSFKDLP